MPLDRDKISSALAVGLDVEAAGPDDAVDADADADADVPGFVVVVVAVAVVDPSDSNVARP